MNRDYILITGTTGFIGSHVAKRFLSENRYQVVAMVRQIKNYKNTKWLRENGAKLYQGLFYNIKDLDEVFKKFPIKYVIHIAALRGAGAGGIKDYQKVNVAGTQALLNASMEYGVRRFIFCSSVGVFGTIPQKVPADLSTPLNGDNEYHQSKIQGEKLVRKFIEKGLDCFIIRPAITYGEGDDGFSAILIKLARKKMLILTRQETMVHLVSVEKLANLFFLLIAQGKQNPRIIFGIDKKPIKLKQLADIIHDHFHQKSYPDMLRVPNPFFLIAIRFCELFQNEKWKARFQLLSTDWYYKKDKNEGAPELEMADTEKDFKHYLQSSFR